ncbi:aspartyl-phosphate phosphatase Spo0E family protein [Paenibacillus sp. GYB003]|uniref:aspartyl-phosphate phosphatase Spo0E family protein n=1 Tax=Paenibacillus sp. GYB003 TaxID=2994392 RepID=UPI002F963D32
MATDVGFDEHPQAIGTGKEHDPLHRPYRVIRKPRSEAADAAHALQDEISSLRRQMEEAFVQCDCFTSESVMAISRLLDIKINEYMKAVRKD